MLAHDGDVTGNRIGPARSSCAIHVGSYNANRESIYVQQQTISAEGLSGDRLQHQRAAHRARRAARRTIRRPGQRPRRRTRGLSARPHRDQDLHRLPSLAERRQQRHHGPAPDAGDQLRQLHRPLLLGGGGRPWPGGRGRHRARRAAGRHRQLAAPAGLSRTTYRKHVERRRQLEHAHEHPGRDIGERLLRRPRRSSSIQARGEYLYAACGESGLRVFDIAFIDHKGFSERIVTAPVSPLGQRFYVRTKYATAVAAPTTVAPDPTRTHRPENREQPVHALYGYIYVTDSVRGPDPRRRPARCSTATRSTTSSAAS